MLEQVALQPVDAADVTILVDNAIDILVPSTPLAERPPWVWEWSEQPPLRAEHGYSLVLTVHRAGHSDTILYDAGLGGIQQFTIWTCWTSIPSTSALWCCRTVMQTITVAWRVCLAAAGG